MHRTPKWYPWFIGIVVAASSLVTGLAFGKGCGQVELKIDKPTWVRSEIGRVRILPGQVRFCREGFGEKTEPDLSNLEQNFYVVSSVRLAEKTSLGGIHLKKATEISFPDIYNHSDSDFSIQSGGIYNLGGVSLVATPSLPIAVNAYERVEDAAAPQIHKWQLRADKRIKVSGELVKNVTLSTIPLAAGNPVSFEGAFESLDKFDTASLRLIDGIVAGQFYYSGTKAKVLLDITDRVIFREKTRQMPSPLTFQVITSEIKFLSVDGKVAKAKGRLFYLEEEGSLDSFSPAEPFTSNQMVIPAVGEGALKQSALNTAVGLYPSGKLAWAIPLVGQKVQGVNLKADWNPVYFWENGTLMHAAEVEDPTYLSFTWEGKKVTAFSVSLSFDAKGKLRLLYASQAHVEGDAKEFSGLWELKDGVYQLVAETDPVHKWYDWRGYNPELKAWLDQFSI